MNKEIEEMARDIQSAVNGCATYWAELIAKYLTEQGYQKIDKDKVVLTREEYENHIIMTKVNYESIMQQLKQARKETAREILETIKSYDGWNELQRLRDDIAEAYGVEIKE